MSVKSRPGTGNQAAGSKSSEIMLAQPTAGRRVKPLDTGRARVEDLAVEVDVELDRGEAPGRGVDPRAEGGELPVARARPPRIAHVVVGAVLGLADPFAGRLVRRAGGGERVPAARRRPVHPGADDAVLVGPALRGG